MSERELKEALAKAEHYVLDDLSAMTAPWPDLQLISRVLLSSRPLILEEAAKVAEEMFLAPSGLGKYAADWADKPHRVLYDAVNLIRSLSHDGKAPDKEGEAG